MRTVPDSVRCGLRWKSFQQCLTIPCEVALTVPRQFSSALFAETAAIMWPRREPIRKIIRGTRFASKSSYYTWEAVVIISANFVLYSFRSPRLRSWCLGQETAKKLTRKL